IILAQSSVKTPITNGQVEVMNKNIIIALKKKVDEAKRAKLDELPRIVSKVKPIGVLPFLYKFIPSSSRKKVHIKV
ncbi:hypothetical protein J1N35_008375, partial [Gossypium stocksii]